MLNKTLANSIAVFLLILMFVLMFASARNDSAIMDELAHIPAGYSYLTQADYRLNPEHPPLIKDIAAFPLLFLDLNFPKYSSYWQKDVNGQWAFGAEFLYESGNDPNLILYYARLPLILITILFGWFFYSWTSRRFGYGTALLALLFFITSPTFIAHGRYVTTDIGATLGFFLGITAFIAFLEHRNDNARMQRKYLLLAGFTFGIAQLLKFSLFLLVPLYAILGTLWVIADKWHDYNGLQRTRSRLKLFLKEEGRMIREIILIGFIGVVVISLIYTPHTWNYPVEHQINDMEITLSSFGFRPLVDLNLWMAKTPLLRPLSEYFFGLLMVVQRAAGGNTVYFLGEVGGGGWWYYFPLAYLLKEQLALHLFAFIAVVFGAIRIRRAPEKTPTAVIEWIRANFPLTAGAIFVVFYFYQSISSNLNIGVRHILPAFPFIYLLTARGIANWLTPVIAGNQQNIRGYLSGVYERWLRYFPRYAISAVFMLWLLIEIILTYPFYLSYYNELAGGPRDGYKYIVDSNYDWGQDLVRLKNFVDEMGIENIKLDYFGGGSARYYLGMKFEPWRSANGAPQPGEWFAVSVTQLQNASGQPIPGTMIKPEDSYSWLRNKELFARAGESIFIYQF